MDTFYFEMDSSFRFAPFGMTIYLFYGGGERRGDLLKQIASPFPFIYQSRLSFRMK